MNDVMFFWKGLMIGLAVSIPLGPMGVLIIQKTLKSGHLAGFVSGMGAACADLFYASLAAFGVGYIIDTIQSHQFTLQVVGGIFLVIMGAAIYFDNPLKAIRRRSKVTKTGLLGDFLSLFFLTASNPVSIIVFLAVFAGTAVFGYDPSLQTELIVLLGIFLGGTLWWYTLSLLVNIFRKKFKLRLLVKINKVAGVLVIILGFFAILSAFEPLRSLVNNV